MHTRDEDLLEAAVHAVRAANLTAEEASASAQRVAERLGAAGFTDPAQRGKGSAGADAVDWAPPVWERAAPAYSRTGRARGPFWRMPVLQWAPVCAVLVCVFLAYKAYWQVPPGVRAQVQSLDGAVYRVSGTGERPLAKGEPLREGEQVRTAGGAHAVLRLADGSSVEMNERSVVAVAAKGRDLTLALGNGDVIVQAATRSAGHLFVRTDDLRVAVTGTIFAVDAGIKGSRVAVIKGAVDVRHEGADTILQAGDQLASSDNLVAAPVAQQIGWSQDRAKYISLLAQLAGLQHRLEQLPFPQARYSSDLLNRVPADSLLYVSIPNLGEFLSEANALFQDQLQQSPELREWWSKGGKRNSEELTSLVGKLHEMSSYLGSEVVIVGFNQANGSKGSPGYAVVADLQKAGLADLLARQFAPSAGSPGFTVLTEETLRSAESKTEGSFALVRPHEVVFSTNVAALRQMSRQLDASASGFADSNLGRQVSEAYGRGAGVIVAADLHQMMLQRGQAADSSGSSAGGMEDVRYLLVEHRELNGEPENHLSVQFAGPRQQVASWLAAPAPIDSLNFVSPNAAVAVAVLSKDPKSIADDVLAMAATGKAAPGHDFAVNSEGMDVNLRDDLAADFGGDFLMALDGPVLPTPAWKIVAEVRDADRLEQTLERFAQWTQGRKTGAPALTISTSEVGGQKFYAVLNTGTGMTLAEYTFANGYLVLAPDRALVQQALHTWASGNSLARSPSFKALLPRDENENYSAVAYQNLSPVLTPLLTQFSGPKAAAIRQMAAEARPTAICAWGKDDEIEAGSKSHLLSFDLLSLGALLKGNQAATKTVPE